VFGLSFGELVIIFGVALLVLGPKGLPELARKLGGWMRQFRSATSELRGTFESEFYKMDGGPTAGPGVRPVRSVENAVARPSGPSALTGVLPTTTPPSPTVTASVSPLEAPLSTGTAPAPATPEPAPSPAPPAPEGKA